MNWFQGCSTSEQVRERYRDLAKKYHPDLGGDTAKMQAINAQYSEACKRFVRKENPNRTEKEYANMDSVNEALRYVILKLLNLRDITIEVCGMWIWVGGQTRQHKEILKALGLKWAYKKKLWFYAGVPMRGYHRGSYKMDDIRAKFGSKIVRDEEDVREYV